MQQGHFVLACGRQTELLVDHGQKLLGSGPGIENHGQGNISLLAPQDVPDKERLP
jgi:hypothetical protein